MPLLGAILGFVAGIVVAAIILMIACLFSGPSGRPNGITALFGLCQIPVTVLYCTLYGFRHGVPI